MTVFYICSLGNSGELLLKENLEKIGEVHIIYDTKIPLFLEYIGTQKGGKELKNHFNGIPIPINQLFDYKVIFLYNPSVSFFIDLDKNDYLKELLNIDSNIKLIDNLDKNCDLFNINKFFTQIFNNHFDRNYDIYFINILKLETYEKSIKTLLNIDKCNLLENYNTFLENIKNIENQIDSQTKDKLLQLFPILKTNEPLIVL